MIYIFIFLIFILTFTLVIALYAYYKTPLDERSGRKYISLEKIEHCCHCKNNKIIHGAIRSSEGGAYFTSAEFNCKFLSKTKHPGADIEKYHFTLCTECGLLGGFVDISNIQNELKVYGKQSLLDKLNNTEPVDDQN